MNTLKKILLSTLIACGGTAFSQVYEGDFAWASSTVATVSSTTIEDCSNSPIDIRLTSSLDHREGSGATSGRAFIPSPSRQVGDIDVTLNFSTPVTNLSLLINDIDQAFAAFGSPAEYIDGLTPGYTITAIGASPVYATTGGYDLHPNSGENTKGWVSWTGPISSVSFTYFRPTATTSAGAAITLDSIKFDCATPVICSCKPESNYFANPTTKIDKSGFTSTDIHVSSNGEEIRKLSISIPTFTPLMDPSCIKCDPSDLGKYGHILNLPTIAGIDPTFVGGTGSSTEIQYLFPTPTVVDEDISLKIQFPAVLELSCCDNKVEYCLQIEMIDKECNVCETLICNTKSESDEKKSAISKGAKMSNMNTAINDHQKQTALTISPNPTTNFIGLELAEGTGSIAIYNLQGEVVLSQEVIAKTTRVNVSNLENGTYVVKHTFGAETVTGKFTKQ